MHVGKHVSSKPRAAPQFPPTATCVDIFASISTPSTSARRRGGVGLRRGPPGGPSERLRRRRGPSKAASASPASRVVPAPRRTAPAPRGAAKRPSTPRGRLGTARGPRGCPRRPGARRRRRGVAYLPPRRSELRRPRSGAVLEFTPVAPRDAPVAVRNGSESKKKRPTAVIPGKDLVEPPRTAPGPRRVPRGRLEKGPSRRRRGSQLSTNIELFILHAWLVPGQLRVLGGVPGLDLRVVVQGHDELRELLVL